MRKLFSTTAMLFSLVGTASAEPFQEVTIGIPVSSIAEAEAWYTSFLGSNVETIKPFPGVVELKASKGVWIQLFETEDKQQSQTIVRFLVDDMAEAQDGRSKLGIDTGTAIEVPGVVTFSEFADPFGNALGLYDLP